MLAWSRGFYGYYNLAFVTIVNALMQGAFYTVGINGPMMAREFGWSATEYGAASTVYLIAIGVSSLLAGVLIPRVGARRLMVWISPLAPIALFGMSFVTEPWHLSAWTAVLGFSNGLGIAVAGPLIAANWLSKRRGLGIAIVIASSQILAIVWSQLTVALTGVVDSWRQIAQIEAAIVLVAPLVAILFVRERPEDLGQSVDGVPLSETPAATTGSRSLRVFKTTADWTGKQALRSRVFWLITVACGIEAFVFLGITAHQVTIFEAGGLDVAAATTAFGLVITIGGLGRIVGGWFTDYIEPRFILAFFQLTLGAGILLFALAHTWPGALYVYIVTVGIAGGEIFLLATVLFVNYFGPKAYPALAGVANPLFSLLFGGAGPIVVGSLFDTVGDFEPVLIGLGIAGIVASVASLAARPPKAPAQASAQATADAGSA
ncbi:CynX/NimT family MFS transporter [Pseudonocardia halophobica]|nr:MFS transporter [Pseudonocardia halophobica]